MKQLKKLLNVFYVFSISGIQMFGNLTTIIPTFERELINKRNMITKDDLLDCIAIGRCGPGAAVINTVALLGNKIGGFIGGTVATLGFVFFPFISILLISIALENFLDKDILKNFCSGALCCLSIFIIKSMVEIGKSTIVDKLTLCIFISTIILSIFTDIPIFIYIIITGILGIVFYKK